tara:strand:+ start:21802 stop:21996 length:195 start_codon:yes stop_codon:yes gene_type:complete
MRMGSAEHFERIYNKIGLVTLGDDKKIAYQEQEILALMQEKKVLANYIDKQEIIIERLKERLNR